MVATGWTNLRNRVVAVARFGAAADAPRLEPVVGGGNEGRLEVGVGLHRHGSREGVHVKELDALGNGIPDHHTPGVAINEGSSRGVLLDGDHQRRLDVAEVAEARRRINSVFSARDRARLLQRLQEPPRGAAERVDAGQAS